MNNSSKIVREMRQGILSPWIFTAIGRKFRNLPAIVGVPACAAILFAALSLPAFGQTSLGGVGGVTRDSDSGKPLPDAQITLHEMHKNTEFSAVSGANGAFVIALEPGWYEVTATKNGFVKSSARVRVA